MNLSFENETLERISQANDIVSVVKEYVPLTFDGSSWRGDCPFCNTDRHFSLSIRPERGLYKCYECRNAGHVFTFVQAIEKVSFKNAVSILAKRAGLPLPHKNLIQKLISKSWRNK